MPSGRQDDLESLLTRGYRFALSLTHDEGQAEDLVQDAWTSLLRREAPRHVGYLFRTIRNRFYDLERRRNLVIIEPGGDEPHFDPVSWLDEEAAATSRLTLVRALGELRSAEREVLFLIAVEGHTLAETAEITQRPIGTVASLLRRARSKLRNLTDRREAAS